MNLKRRFIFVFVVALLALFVALPANMKEGVSNVLPDQLKWLTDSEISKGLDLAGGVGLDYKIDLSKVPEERVQMVKQGIREVINERVNTLGVSEPNIVLVQIGDEEHIQVNLAGVSDVQEAKDTIGKTIQLEFKVQKTELDDAEQGNIKGEAQVIFEKAKAEPDSFQFLMEEAKVTAGGKVTTGSKSQFADELPAQFRDKIVATKAGQIIDTLEEASFTNLEDGAYTSDTGYVVIKLDEVVDELRMFPAAAIDFMDVAKEYSDSKDVELAMIKSDEEPAKKDYIKKGLETMSVGQVSDVMESEDGYVVLKMLEQVPADEEQVKASHILITKQEAKTIPAEATEEEKAKIEQENADITKANEEAKKKAEDLLTKVKADSSTFAELAKSNSQDPGSAANGGDLGFFGRGTMVAPFETAAFTTEVGQITDHLVESQFGYHIIQVNSKKPKDVTWGKFQQIVVCYQGAMNAACADSTRTKEQAKVRAEEAMKKARTESKYNYSYVLYSTIPDPWKPAEVDGEQLTGEHFQRADVAYQGISPVVSISFTDQGAKLFEELTGKYVGQPMAIFVGGNLISAPRINEKIIGGEAVITGNFTTKEAYNLARDLNTGAIPAPISLAGEEIVGPELGAKALTQSLTAGIWGLLIVCAYLILFYRTSGVIATIVIIVYALLFLAFIKLLPGFNLTLSSAAAIILSIGMAVDGNVLVFERLREEMSKTDHLFANIEKAFKRAWPAIRDSQVSSIITAFLLFIIGTDQVKGFAVFLLIGIVLSLFTVVYVTKVLMLSFAKTKSGEKLLAWGMKKK